MNAPSGLGTATQAIARDGFECCEGGPGEVSGHRVRATTETMKPINAELATEAVRLVTGDRQAAYDHPSVNFQRIADLWSPILGIKVTPQQVALCSVQIKIAREIHAHKADNLTDAIGYLLCLDACIDG